MSNKKLPIRKSPQKAAYRSYSYALKREVVHMVEIGKMSIEQARVHYNIKGKSLIYNWIKKYGLLNYQPNKIYAMKKSPQEKIKELQMKIEELEFDKKIILDMYQVLQEDFDIPVKKYLPEPLIKDLKNHIKKG